VAGWFPVEVWTVRGRQISCLYQQSNHDSLAVRSEVYPPYQLVRMVASFGRDSSVATELSCSNWNVVEARIAVAAKALVSQLS
jgi:hypothetical protein